MLNLESGLEQTFRLDRMALMFHQGAINNFHAIGLGDILRNAIFVVVPNRSEANK